VNEMGKAEMKVPGGKLLRACSKIQEGNITSVLLTGDFFLHPEESIEEMERRLRGIPAHRDSVQNVVQQFFDTVSPRLIGATPDSFVEIIMRSLSTTT